MILGILQARTSSTRLPGKVMLPLLKTPMLVRQIERLQRSKRMNRLVVATSKDPSDNPLETLCLKQDIPIFRGSLEDVLDRFYRAAEPTKAEHIVRLTGDCPLTDAGLIDRLIDFHLQGNFDYTSNTIPPTFPDGLDVEVFRASCLKEAWQEARLPSEREHVTPFIIQHPDRYRLGSFKNGQDLSHLRWTVDEQEDFDLVSLVYEELYPKNKNFSMVDILALLDRKPELKEMNTKYRRNEGYERSLKKDAVATDRYTESEKLLKRALKTIPLGTQTFSKSKTQFPLGVSPYYIEKAQGSHVWDADGNEYVDFANSLAAVTLGYNDPEVTAAVQAQLEKGVIFSLPAPLEIEVAEKIVEMVPCAEMVRFGKNGSDATAGAIRLARAFTHRDHVAVCGYHGWQDWYIGSTARHLGVPQATRDLTHTFTYNQLETLEALFKQFPSQIAAVIMEPMNVTKPQPGFLENLKELTRREGALLVFDETITGFRFSNGGAQEYFNVTPDLATFGKGVANGYPLSVVAGRAEIMKLMEEIFFSFTFGGETLSLAASLATLNKLQMESVVATLKRQGEKVIAGVKNLIEKHQAGSFISISGHPAWSFLNFKEAAPYSAFDIKTLFLQEVFSRGILTLGTHNISYAHADRDIEKLLSAYDEIFPLLAEAVSQKRLHELLKCEPLRPLFKLR